MSAIEYIPSPCVSTETSVVHDLMIHDIDIVLHLIESELTEVDAHGSRVISPTEDLAHARLSFASGATAFVKTSRVAFSRSRKVRIFGPRQYISLDLVDRTGFQVSLDSEYDPADFLDTAGRLDAPRVPSHSSLSIFTKSPLKLVVPNRCAQSWKPLWTLRKDFVLLRFPVLRV